MLEFCNDSSIKLWKALLEWEKQIVIQSSILIKWDNSIYDKSPKYEETSQVAYYAQFFSMGK